MLSHCIEIYPGNVPLDGLSFRLVLFVWSRPPKKVLFILGNNFQTLLTVTVPEIIVQWLFYQSGRRHILSPCNECGCKKHISVPEQQSGTLTRWQRTKNRSISYISTVIWTITWKVAQHEGHHHFRGTTTRNFWGQLIKKILVELKRFARALRATSLFLFGKMGQRSLHVLWEAHLKNVFNVFLP